ncbi:olfactory receptor 6C2-like [Loxodonta africana]|uniref:olfactory receptor 6C2-like n=1 Tax=Loxodonta africana TaxID=9785 RepID=UPI0030CDFE37
MTEDPKLQIVLLVFLFLTYFLCVAGNMTIITLTLLHSHLQTPMYFFLRNFSFLEVSFTSVCIPRFLYSLTTGDKTCTYNACATQLLFGILFGATEFFLFAAMSYDRYVAICMGLQLEFCDSNLVDSFACDAYPILQITCSDTELIEKVVLAFTVLTLISTLLGVLLSYTYIISTILKFPSAQQRKKAFSTCSSHMIVVSMSYGSSIFAYIKPSRNEGVALNKLVGLLFTSVVPMLNPFIYTLRNKQVKEAFKDTVKRIAFLIKK